MKHNTSESRRWLIAAITFAAFTTHAATGVWTNVSGGYWADSNNWENAYVPLGAGNRADFSALGTGGTVTITNNTGIGSIFFAGAEGDVWTLAAENGAELGWDNDPRPETENGGEIRVEGGTLTLHPAFYWAAGGIAKTGSGRLRLTTPYTYTSATRLDEGTLLLTNSAALPLSAICFNGTNALLALEADALVGGVRSLVERTPNIALNGHALRIGGSGKNYEWGGQFTGGGSVTMVRAEVQTLTKTQDLKSVRLENGSLQLGKAAVGRTVAWYRFESLGTLGQDSGTLGNNLTAAGAPSWTDDPERGGVLSLNGSSYLTGSGPDTGLSGLPAGNSPFTVAFWLKPDSGVDSSAGLFKWGTDMAALAMNGMRLNTPSSSTPLLYTNWINNREIPSSVNLADGAWHHVAIVYTGTRHQFFIDGALCLEAEQAPALGVAARSFCLGRGWSTSYFKGLLDDFVIADWAMNMENLYAVRVAGQEPDLSGYTLNNLLPVTANLEVGYNGILRLLGDQTVATLGGAGAAGGIALQNGGTLAANGTGTTTSTVFRSAITGDGRFVKSGADYTLTLSGALSYTGATEVAGGQLRLSPQGVPGLQAYYRFDDPARLGRDSSGNGYDLNASGAPAYQANGKVNGAAQFKKSTLDMLVSTGTFPATLPAGNSSYTFAFWCNPDDSGNTSGGIFGLGYTAWNGGGNLLRFISPTKILVSNYGNNLEVPTDDLFSNSLSNGWHHIATTYEATNRARKVYVDGVLKLGDTLAGNLNVTNNGTLRLGDTPTTTDQCYDGLLDETMIFDRALSGTEIRALLAGAPAGLETPRYAESLVARYSFEAASAPGKDSGAYGYDLAASSSTVKVVANGKRGGALDLSAGYGYLAWTNSVFPEMMPTGNQAVTLSLWFNPVTGADAEGTLLTWGAMNAGQCHLLRLMVNAGRLGVRYTNAQLGLETTAVDGLALGLGAAGEGWHHLAAVYNPAAVGVNRRLYLDGVLVAQDGQKNLTVTPSLFSIGYRESATDKWFQGMIDEVEIYNRAFSQAEVLTVLRGGTDILPAGSALAVAAGAAVDLDGAAQRVAALSGGGEVNLGLGGLAITGGEGLFSGTLSGSGLLAIRDGAVQTLSGASTFRGAVTVSNATLLAANTGGSATGNGSAVTVQNGGRFGGAGAIAGNVAFENGSGIAAGDGTDTLAVSGTVTLGASGTVALEQPAGFSGGTFALIAAASVSAPSGLSGWTVTPAPVNMATSLKISGGTLSLSVFRQGTVLTVR
ncbi:MAG TPA: autotransporter-associated beta strand repeat-containing protein [Kiritimatiellia bacterium]|nr:autotransporter-associated beta strand repeat-containing protein [Kiritimatiellia bacterium]